MVKAAGGASARRPGTTLAGPPEKMIAFGPKAARKASSTRL